MREIELIENKKMPILKSYSGVYFSVAIYDGEELVFVGKTNRNPHLLAYTKKEDCRITDDHASFVVKQFDTDEAATNYAAELIATFNPRFNSAMIQGQTIYYSSAKAKKDFGLEPEDFEKIHADCGGIVCCNSKYLTREDIKSGNIASLMGNKYYVIGEDTKKLARFFLNFTPAFNDTALMGSFRSPEEYTEFSEMLLKLMDQPVYTVIATSGGGVTLEQGNDTFVAKPGDLAPKKLMYVSQRYIARSTSFDLLWEQSGDIVRVGTKVTVLKNDTWRKANSVWANA